MIFSIPIQKSIFEYYKYSPCRMIFFHFTLKSWIFNYFLKKLKTWRFFQWRLGDFIKKNIAFIYEISYDPKSSIKLSKKKIYLFWKKKIKKNSEVIFEILPSIYEYIKTMILSKQLSWIAWAIQVFTLLS